MGVGTLSDDGSQSTIKMEKGYYRLGLAVATKKPASQSTIKMEKGYYGGLLISQALTMVVAIHNKNGKGLLHAKQLESKTVSRIVAIHNKNGKGLLLDKQPSQPKQLICRNPQ